MEIYGAKWTEVGQLLATVAGFGFIIYQISQLWRSTAGETYSSLYRQYLDVCKLFLEKPYLRPYFYDSVAVDPKLAGSSPLGQELEVMCEVVTGLLEHAAQQRPNLPGAYWEECWREYTKERFARSPVMRSFWEANKGWYAREFRELVAALNE